MTINSGFTLDFGVPLSAVSASNFELDTVTTKTVKKKKETILHPIKKFTVSYLPASDAVEIKLGATETFPTGGQITVQGGLTTAAGGTLTDEDYRTLYFRTTPVFETGDLRYLWLNDIVSVAMGGAISNGVKYDVFEVL